MWLRKLHMPRLIPAAVGIAVVGALIGAQPAFAADQRSGERVVIGSGEVIDDDLYVTANTVIIDGTVHGDVVAAGASVTINGTVDGDVLAVGQAVVLNGALHDDVRVAGMAVQLGSNAQVGDDVIAAGNSIEQQAGSVIGGDAYLGASQALLAGTTHGNVKGGFAALEVRGTIDGDASVSVGGTNDVVVTPWSPGLGISTPAVRSGLTIDDNARIGGKLSYTAPQDGTVRSGATVTNGISRTPIAPSATISPYAWLIDLLRRYVTLLVIGLLALWLVPSWIGQLGTTVRNRPFASFGWGTVGFAGVIALLLLIPLVAILLMVLFGSLTLGGLAGITFVLGTALTTALITGFAVLVSYMVQIIVGLMVGRWLLGLAQPRLAESRVGALALGLALYVVLRAIPNVGFLVAIIVTLLGLGAIWQWLGTRLRRTPGAPPFVPAPQM